MAVVCLLLVITPVGIFAWASIRVLRAQAIEKVFQESVQKGQLSADLVSDHFGQSQTLLEAIAQRPLLRQAWARGDMASVTAQFHNLARLRTDFSFFTAFTPDGTMRAIWPPDATLGRSFSYRDWYRGVTREWTPYTSDVYQTAVGNHPLVVAVAVPLRDAQQRPNGILIATHRLDTINAWLHDVRHVGAATISVLDQHGHLLAGTHVDPFRPAEDRGGEAAVQRGLQGESGVGFFDHDGAREITAYRAIPALHWVVLVEEPAAVAMQGVVALQRRLVGLGVLVTLLALGLGAFLVSLMRELESAERFFALSQDLLAIGDFRGYFRRLNPAWALKLGFTEDELLGRPYVDFVHSADRVGVELAAQDLAKGKEVNFDCRTLRRDGSYRRLHWSAASSPSRQRFFAVARDVTAEREALAALENLRRHNELILNSVGDGLVGLDMNGIVIFANPAAAAMTGWTAEELQGSVWHERIHDRHADGSVYPEEDCPTYHALRDGKPRAITSEVFWRRDGSSFPVEYLTALLRSEDGRISGAVLSFRDITHRRQAEQAKDELVGLVSHELRTPLTSIRGALGLLVSGKLGALPERGQRMMDIAVANTDRLVRLINDVLDIERMESGHAPLVLRDVVIGDLMQQAADTLRPLAEQAGVTLEVSRLDILVCVDADRILQMLTNLLSNAIRFSLAGARVELLGKAEPGNVHIEVRDSGRGIPANKLDAIFERFQQVDAADAREKAGSGLGLPICRSIVQRHRGRIWVESRMGEGSVFHVSLPGLRSDQLPTAPPAGVEIRDVESETSAKLILVCDDDPSTREVIGATLEAGGYRVALAATGDEAVRQARLMLPDVMLLDLLMPGMNGWQTMQELTRHPETRDLPVVIFSGLSASVAHAGSGNVAGWVHKPANDAALFQALERALAGAEAIARVLLVEDDSDLAGILVELLRQTGVETLHAGTQREAVEVSARALPDLLILDLGLADGTGFEVVAALRRHAELRFMPVVVFSARDLTPEEQELLRLGPTAFLTKSRSTLEEVLAHVANLLRHLSGRQRSPQ